MMLLPAKQERERERKWRGEAGQTTDPHRLAEIQAKQAGRQGGRQAARVVIKCRELL